MDNHFYILVQIVVYPKKNHFLFTMKKVNKEDKPDGRKVTWQQQQQLFPFPKNLTWHCLNRSNLSFLHALQSACEPEPTLETEQHTVGPLKENFFFHFHHNFKCLDQHHNDLHWWLTSRGRRLCSKPINFTYFSIW